MKKKAKVRIKLMCIWTNKGMQFCNDISRIRYVLFRLQIVHTFSTTPKQKDMIPEISWNIRKKNPVYFKNSMNI